MAVAGLHAEHTHRVGPVRLAAGVTGLNFWAFMYASFIVIGMLAGMNFLQPIVLTEILAIPQRTHGTVSGDLGLWQEIIAILLINPFGWLADRVGRRPLMIFGIVVCGIGYALYPYATTVADLTLYRVIFAIGAACLAALIAIVANDYPAESSRGKLIGLGNMMNGVGVLFISAVIAQIPAWLHSQGADMTQSVQVMFLIVAVICILSGLYFHRGLKGGRPAQTGSRKPWRELMFSGIVAARNPRILLSYGAAFIGRADVSIKGMFFSLWAIAAAPSVDMAPAEAMGRAGMMFGIMSLAGMLWVPLFGVILDRVNRVTGLAVALGLAGVAYSSMMFVTSPLDFAMLPAFLVLLIGQVSVMASSITLVGQEADIETRGAVIAMNGFFGAIGILIAFAVGGRLFDAMGPSAPFVMIGIIQLVLFVVTIAVRVISPGKEKNSWHS